MTTINQANAVYYRVGQLGGGAASAVYAGAVKVWPPVLTYPDVILGTAGLRAYWRMGEASGLLQDAKGTNHASSFGGTPGYGAPGAVAGNTAVSFNGSAWFIIPDANALDFGNFPFTIEFWYKRTVNNVTELLISKGNAFEIVQDGGNALYLANQSTPAAFGPVTTDTAWHYYAFVRPSAVVAETRVYRDGVDATASTGSSAFASNAQPLTFGGRGVLRDILGDRLGDTVEPLAPGLLLHGVLDEIALYAVALTPAQVLAHWNAR